MTYSSILLLLFLPSSLAQLTFGNAPVPDNTLPTTLAIESIPSTPALSLLSTSLLPAFQTGFQTPDPTRSAPTSLSTANPDPSNVSDSHTGIVNYYFLLLAIFIFLVIILYITWTRNRRRRVLHYQRSRQHVLSHDVNTGGYSGWTYNRRGMRPPRPEGLNERGEAPPPYMPAQPQSAVFRNGGVGNNQWQNVPLQDLPSNQRKPPDYTTQSTTRR
jgi:hypothetical protein